MKKKAMDYLELGNGSIDFTVILPEASRAVLQYYDIEQGDNLAKETEGVEVYSLTLDN